MWLTQVNGQALQVTNSIVNLYSTTTWLSGSIPLTNTLINNFGTFNIQIAGPTSILDVPQIGSSTFANMPTGVIQVAGGPVTFNKVNVTSAGNVYLNGQTLNCRWGFTQTGGRVDLGSGGTLNLLGGLGGGQPTNYLLQGGRLVGTNSTLTGMNLIQSDGTFEIAGNVSLSGDYTQEDGTFQVDLWSADSESFAVGGTAEISANLVVSLMGGYTPNVGTGLTILSPATLIGMYSSFTPGWLLEYPAAVVIQWAGCVGAPPPPP
jgi:hypothetical protein